ncbi:hypothetical protein QOT17_007942 [Balamuthia mandrillaris]
MEADATPVVGKEGRTKGVVLLLPVRQDKARWKGWEEVLRQGKKEGLRWALPPSPPQRGIGDALEGCVVVEEERMFTKAQLQFLLALANEKRLSKEVQDKYTEKDDPAWTVEVTLAFHVALLKDFGVPEELIDKALDEFFSARYTYRFDPEMQFFLKDLLHVKYDLTGDGPLRVGQEVPECQLHDLHGNPKLLSSFVQRSVESGRPLVVFAGSWT